MSGSDITSIVLLGLGCAANPWGIMVAVLLLNARRGLWIVWAYVVAWIASISVVMALILAGFGSSSASSSTTSRAASIAELVIGLVLLAFGGWRLLKARQNASTGTSRTEQEQPRWLQCDRGYLPHRRLPDRDLLGDVSPRRRCSGGDPSRRSEQRRSGYPRRSLRHPRLVDGLCGGGARHLCLLSISAVPREDAGLADRSQRRGDDRNPPGLWHRHSTARGIQSL